MTIKRWIEKFKAYGTLTLDRPRSGRPSKFSQKLKTSIENVVRENEAMSYKDVAKAVEGVKKVSKSSIARHLRKLGKKYRPKNLSILSERNVEKRLAYCHRWKDHHLSNIIYSDESRFELNRNKKYFFKFKGEDSKWVLRYNPNFSIMVWGAISCRGRIHLEKITGTMDMEKYKKVLEEKLVPAADAKHGEGRWIFQQDNARCHTGITVRDWFASNRITVIDHPPQSLT